MLGAMIGDTLGSSFEFYPMKTKKFELLEKYSHFTDDTVMTVAVADSIMNEVPYKSFVHFQQSLSRQIFL